MWTTIVELFRDADIQNWGRMLGYLITGVVSAVALIISIKTQKKTAELSHYGEIDKMYLEILKMAVERPYLRNVKAITTDVERGGYDVYAYIVMNFVETIYDRSEAHADLLKTWMPVVLVEKELHRAWFNAPENMPKFKKPFRDWIASLKKEPAGEPGRDVPQ